MRAPSIRRVVGIAIIAVFDFVDVPSVGFWLSLLLAFISFGPLVAAGAVDATKQSTKRLKGENTTNKALFPRLEPSSTDLSVKNNLPASANQAS